MIEAGYLSLTLKHTATAVNASATWRALVAAPNATWEELVILATADTSDAVVSRARIYYGAIEEPTITTARCIVRVMTDSEVEAEATGSQIGVTAVRILFESPIPDDYAGTWATSFLWWSNVLGTILQEIKAAQYVTANALAIDRVSTGPFGLYEPDETQGVYTASAEITAYASEVH